MTNTKKVWTQNLISKALTTLFILPVALPATAAQAASYCEDIQPGVTFCAKDKVGYTANFTIYEGNSKTADLDVTCTNLGNGTYEFEYDGRSAYDQKTTHDVVGGFCDGFLF